MPHPKKANCSQRSGSFWRTAEQPQMQVQASMKEGRVRKQPFKSLEEALGRHTDMMVRRMPLPTRTEPCTSVLRRVGPPSVITVSQRKARPMLPRSTRKAFPHQSSTRSYTTPESSKACARHCVEWLWQQHQNKHPSVQCPLDLGDAAGGEALSYIVFSFACALPPSEPSHAQRPATR